MYYMYILESKKDKTLYIGLTDNIPKRLKEHNSGMSKYTKGHSPYAIVFYSAFINRSLAVKFERYLKTASGRAFIKKKIN